MFYQMMSGVWCQANVREYVGQKLAAQTLHTQNWWSRSCPMVRARDFSFFCSFNAAMTTASLSCLLQIVQLHPCCIIFKWERNAVALFTVTQAKIRREHYKLQTSGSKGMICDCLGENHYNRLPKLPSLLPSFSNRYSC